MSRERKPPIAVTDGKTQQGNFVAFCTVFPYLKLRRWDSYSSTLVTRYGGMENTAAAGADLELQSQGLLCTSVFVADGG